jgi:hypothetical protein
VLEIVRGDLNDRELLGLRAPRLSQGLTIRFSWAMRGMAIDRVVNRYAGEICAAARERISPKLIKCRFDKFIKIAGQFGHERKPSLQIIAQPDASTPRPAPRAAGYRRRARLSALAGGGAFGSCAVGAGAVAGSSFASAERSGSSRGAGGNLSVSMACRMAAVTAANSSSVRPIVGTNCHPLTCRVKLE